MVTTRRTPGRRTAAGPARRCTGCGRTEAPELRQIGRARPYLSQGQRWLAAGDLDVAWLIPSGNSFAWARFCRTCAPAGTLMDIECTRCGDGPLVLLDEALPGMPADQRARDRAIAFLREAGWHNDDDGMRCPNCAPDGTCTETPGLT